MDIYVYNKLRLIIDFIEKLTNIGKLIANRIYPDHKTICIRLTVKDR